MSEDVDLVLADRFTLSRAWAIAAELVRRHPDLLVSRVVDDDQVPLLIAHDWSERIRIQFDLVAWIQYLDLAGDLQRIEWLDVLQESDPLAVVHRIGREIGLCDAPEVTPRALTYQVVACALAVGVDHRLTWDVRPVVLEPEDPDASDWDTARQVPGGEALAERAIDRALMRAAHEGVLLFHQPLWALYADLTPVALLDSEEGVVVAVESGRHELVEEFEGVGGSVIGVTAAVLGRELA